MIGVGVVGCRIYGARCNATGMGEREWVGLMNARDQF